MFVLVDFIYTIYIKYWYCFYFVCVRVYLLKSIMWFGNSVTCWNILRKTPLDFKIAVSIAYDSAVQKDVCDSSIGNSSCEPKTIFKANFIVKVKYSIKLWTEQRMSSSDLMKHDAVQGVLQVTWQVQLYTDGVVSLWGMNTMIWEVENGLICPLLAGEIFLRDDILYFMLHWKKWIRLQCSLQAKCTIFLEVVGCGTISLFLTVRPAITPTLGWVSSFSFKMNRHIVPLLFFHITF